MALDNRKLDAMTPAELVALMEQHQEKGEKWSRWCRIVDPICAVLLVIAGALAIWCIVCGAIILYPCLCEHLTAGE